MTDREPADDGCSCDALLGGRVRLRQPRRGYRAAIDPVLLAAAVPAAAGDRVLDVGAGTGAAALCLAARVPGCTVVGLERDPRLARAATANAGRSGFAGRVTIVEGDLLAPPAAVASARFDHVMANPPFLPGGEPGTSHPQTGAGARQEGEARLVDWLRFCCARARPRGSVTLVHRADRLDEILAGLRACGAGGLVVFPLWPRAGGLPARRVLVRGRPGLRSPLRLAPGLVLHREGGGFTDAAEAILRDAAALDL